ncbi:unnamed protein product [Durusdinium trenchii]|uniref:Calcium/calmodulin-dependent protein kinase type IV n=2 Tax=Durusdinium trenchii TaxID=1381693 RepID=A0ABP0Q6B4_9DINO
MGSQVSQVNDEYCRVQHVLKQNLQQAPSHTGVLNATIRLRVRDLPLSLGLRRDVSSLVLFYCSPADVGRLSGANRSVHEFCETDAIWEGMLKADFWQTPTSPTTKLHSRLHHVSQRHLSLLNRDVLGFGARDPSQKSSRNKLIKRWQGEVIFRRKQALRARMEMLQMEMNSRIQECREKWTYVIKRRRFFACALWGMGLAGFLKVSRSFISLHTVQMIILATYRLFYRFADVLFRFFIPAALCEQVLMKKSSGSSRFRQILLLIASIFLQHLPIASLWWWQSLVGVFSVWLAGCSVMAVGGIGIVLIASFLAGGAYFTLSRARYLEFSAVEQRDQQEAFIYHEYQAEIRKCRIGLGLPPDEKTSNCNCQVL